MINYSILDAIIFDNKESKSLDSFLHELEQVPETYINSVCAKSFDEMTDKERETTFFSIKKYLEQNV